MVIERIAILFHSLENARIRNPAIANSPGETSRLIYAAAEVSKCRRGVGKWMQKQLPKKSPTRGSRADNIPGMLSIQDSRLCRSYYVYTRSGAQREPPIVRR